MRFCGANVCYYPIIDSVASLLTRRLWPFQAALRRRLPSTFPLNCFVAAICPVPSTASFGLTQLRMIRKYGGAHGQGDVEIGAHSKNR
jgi:hypothetical protein